MADRNERQPQPEGPNESVGGMKIRAQDGEVVIQIAAQFYMRIAPSVALEIAKRIMSAASSATFQNFRRDINQEARKAP